MKSKKFMVLLMAGLLSLGSLGLSTHATEPKADLTNPIYVNYILDKVEDQLEKNSDKQYGVDWDFEIAFVDGKVMVLIEYDKEDAKAFKKISQADLEKLLTTISQEIIKALKQDVEINGVVIEDDATKPALTFMYKDGKLDIK
ncbi:MAG: hypothetical protein ACRCW2_10710 [Cellulosilyticaceae bacterium]